MGDAGREQTEDQGTPERTGERAKEPGERQARRRLRREALLGAGMSLLALWVIGGFFLRPAPWIDLARRLVGKLAFPSG
jgi:hypothetical protein